MDPGSGSTPARLKLTDSAVTTGHLPYSRWLGWSAVLSSGADVLVVEDQEA
jgi:hypothetical protein